MGEFSDRLKHAWNIFLGREAPRDRGPGYYTRPDRIRFSRGNERSIITSIYNRIAIDAAAVPIWHARTDENGRFLEVIPSGLNRCLTLDANIDQTGRALIQDAVMSMLDEGCIAIVPVDTTLNPKVSGSYDIQTMRVGKVVQWYPKDIRVSLYNEETGRKEEVTIPKKMAAIVENPLYSVMNEPNSTLQRLIHKLNLLDAVDEQTSSGKLDLIIQLPYVVKSQTRRDQAELRRKDIETQLSGSRYGIAYTDGTERITQLNRPVENNLMNQIEYLTNLLYSQLGLTTAVFDGSADEQVMLNYYNRTIEPILAAICDEMKRKFLTRTALSQHQSIIFLRDPFRLVPVNSMADIADKFTRNEILSTNEVRKIIGYRPSDDPRADELRNKNLNQNEDSEPIVSPDEIVKKNDTQIPSTG